MDIPRSGNIPRERVGGWEMREIDPWAPGVLMATLGFVPVNLYLAV